MNEFFKDKFPFAYNYFTTLIEQVKNNNKKFPQALIFEGNDTISQYLFTLELARMLNCKNDGKTDCACTNCKWIQTFSHPAINIVSKIHFKPEDDDSKTVISVKQAKEIEKTLLISSDYHRFFIFFASNPYEYSQDELKDFKMLNYKTDNLNYSIEPLTHKSFNIATPNALLKSIEEPPKNVTFVFFTRSKEDILQTIVSRCFVFKLNSKIKKTGTIDFSNILNNYPNIDYLNAIEISDKFQNLIKENQNITSETVFVEFLEYLKNLMLNNINNEQLCLKIKNDINIINKASMYIKASISEKNTFETMMLKIARGC